MGVLIRPRQQDASLGSYRGDGYFVVENLLPPELCDRAVEAALRLDEAKAGTFANVYQPHLLDAEFYRLMCHAPLLSCVEAMVGPPIVGLATQFYYCPPGFSGIMRHQDNYCVEAPVEEFASCWIPLVDVDEKNGCLKIYPGSHRSGMLPVRSLDSTEIRSNFSNIREEAVLPDEMQGVFLPAKRGSGIFLHGSVVHESGSNDGDAFRYAFLATYTRKGAPFRPGNTCKRYEIDLTGHGNS
jgi:ectoine hydroxylase-related dioxygenase (phytanoyl-CoA dioxygenase family)